MADKKQAKTLKKAIKECAAALLASDKITIKPKVIKDYIKQVEKFNRKEPRFNTSEGMKKLNDEILEHQLRANEKQAQIGYLQAQVKRNFRVLIAAHPELTIRQVMTMFLDGLTGDNAGAGLSVWSKMTANANAFVSELSKGVEDALGAGSQYEDFLKDESLVLEVFELFYNGGKKGSDKAKSIKEVIDRLNEKGRRLQNANGADIGILDDFATAQSHDALKLRQLADTSRGSINILFALVKKHGGNFREIAKEKNRIGYNRWKSKILPLLDMERTFADFDIEGEDDLDEIMSVVYKNIKTRSQLVKDPSDPEETIVLIGRGGVAKSVSAHRFLHFKDAVSRRDYHKEYGVGSFAGSFGTNFNIMGQTVGLMETMGPNPDSAFNELVKVAIDESRKAGRGEDLDATSFGRHKKLFDVITGKNSIVQNQFLAQIFSFLRAFQSITKLGLVMLSSIPDLGVMTHNIASNTGESFLPTFFKVIQPFFSAVARKDREFFADTFTTNAQLRMGLLRARYAGLDSDIGQGTRAMNLFYRATGLNWWDASNKKTMAMLWGRILGKNKDVEFENLHKDMQRNFKRFNIGKNEWDLYRKSAVEADGKHYIGPTGSDDIETQAFKDYAKATGNDTANPVVQRQLAKDVDDTLSEMFTNQINNGIATPGPSEALVATWGMQPGTIGGELARSVMQYKSFAYTYARRVLGPAIRRAGAGDDKVSGVVDLLALVAVTGGLGYTSLVMKDAVKGKKTPVSLDTAGKAFVQGGGLGFYADWLFGNYARYGQTLTGQLMGPTFGTLDQFTRMIYSLGSAENSGSATRQFLRSNIPFANLFYTNAAFNYLFFFSLSNYLDPGYLQRRESNARKEDLPQYYISPTEGADLFGSL